MTKKRLLLIAFLPLIAVVVLGVLSILPPRPGVTKANFDRIEKGMTLGEVELIIGQRGLLAYRWDGIVSGGHWEAEDGSSTAIMFVDGCVDDKRWLDSDETILDKIRRWLHLR